MTSILSKSTERVIGCVLKPFFEARGAYGDSQWAYRERRSCMDLLALTVCEWILLLEAGNKVGVYTSDISAAFDRVCSELLVNKCLKVGVGEVMGKFLKDYLAPRTMSVVVDGACSEKRALCDSVYQGTVLGPPLWNVFFADVSQAVAQHGYTEAKFADDLNTYRGHAASTTNDAILVDLLAVQKSVHVWGKRNRVLFDASKESFKIIHRRDNHGDTFKLLGLWLDTKLIMKDAIDKIVHKASPKLTALLRTRAFHTTSDLFNQYKSHVRCLLEMGSGAFYHASDTVLAPLQGIQRRFLREVGIGEQEAFLKYNVAPLQMRRDIGCLGLIHKCVLKLAPESLQRLFPRETRAPHRHCTRLAQQRHNQQLLDRCDGTHSDLLARSIFGLVKVYNLLAQSVVDCQCVKSFQQALTAKAKDACKSNVAGWESMHSARHGC